MAGSLLWAPVGLGESDSGRRWSLWKWLAFQGGSRVVPGWFQGGSVVPGWFQGGSRVIGSRVVPGGHPGTTLEPQPNPEPRWHHPGITKSLPEPCWHHPGTTKSLPGATGNHPGTWNHQQPIWNHTGTTLEPQKNQRGTTLEPMRYLCISRSRA